MMRARYASRRKEFRLSGVTAIVNCAVGNAKRKPNRGAEHGCPVLRFAQRIVGRANSNSSGCPTQSRFWIVWEPVCSAHPSLRYNRRFRPDSRAFCPEVSPLIRQLAVAALTLALLQPGNSATAPATLDGYSPAHAATEREWETKFRSLPDPKSLRDTMQRLSARPHHVGSPYDKDNAEWMLAKFKEFGFDAQIETFYVLFPTPKERVRRAAGAHALHRQAAGAARRHRSHIVADRRAVAHLQRLLQRRRRHRSAGVRELRRARRLRATRSPGRVGEGRDRDRALRRRVARHQAQGRRRARRHRLHHLFRSARRRLLRRPAFSRRPLPSAGRRAARQRDGHRLSRRSADSGRGRDQGRQAPRHHRGQDHHHHSRAAHFLRRRAAAAGGDHRPGGSGKLARRAAHHLSHRAGPGESSSGGQVELGHQAHLRRDREDSRQRRARAVGDSRQPSRCVGEWRGRSGVGHVGGAGGSARPGRADEAGLASQAHHHLLRLGRRRARPAGLDRMGRAARRRAEAARRGVHQFRLQLARISLHVGLAHAGAHGERRWRATCRTPRRR